MNVEVYHYYTVPWYANPCLFNRPIWTYNAIEANVLGTPIPTYMCYPDYTGYSGYWAEMAIELLEL